MNKLFAGLIFLLLVSVIVSPVYSSPIFEYDATSSTEIPLTGGLVSSSPKVAVNNGETFVVWQESPFGIGFSWTGDATYTTGDYAYLDDPAAISSSPQIIVISPTEIYVSAIVDNTADGLLIGAGYYISVTKISDPSSAGSLSFLVAAQDWTHYVFVDGISPPDEYRLSAVTGEAFVTWRLGTDINSAFDTGLGLTASLSNPIATGTVSNIDSILFGAGPYAAVTYNNNTAGEIDVFSVYSSDGGNNFSSPFNISSSSGIDSFNPSIATDGTDIFVAWEEGTGSSKEIYFSQNTTTYSSPIALSSNTGESTNVEIESDSSHIFVAWEDYVTGISLTRDVLFTNSADGVSFATPLNLSSDGKESLNPKITMDGIVDVHVAWLDYTFDNTNGDILIRSSNNNGDSFGGIQIITENSGDPLYPDPVFDVSSDGTVVGAVWSKPSDDEIYMKNGDTTGGIDVLLDATEYTSDTAIVTVRNATANTSGSADIISVKITNLSGGTPSTNQTLTETTSTSGVFTGTVLLSAVNADPGDKIRVDSYNETTTSPLFSTFAILPTDVSIRFNPAVSPLDYGTIYGLTVVDSDADTTGGADTISVTVKSNANPTGIPITLTETGGSTGIFEGTANIAFMNGDFTPLLTDTVTVSQINSTTPDPSIQTSSKFLNSTSDQAGIIITLTETSATSNTYSATINFCDASDLGCSSVASTRTLKAEEGDFFSISSLGGTIKTNGIIDTDTTTNSRGALQVSCTISTCGNVIAEYDPPTGPIVSSTVPVQDAFAPGGGGGGISRAGLVVQAVGAISLFGGGGGNSGPPSFDDASFTLNPGFGGILSGDQLSDGTVSKFEVGKKSDISMGFRMPGGIFNLNHISLYANIDKGQSKYDSDTYIYFDKYKNPQITIHDPHGFFKSVNIDVTEPTKNNLDVNFAFDFVKSLDKSTVIFEAWNNDRQSALKEIPDLLNVDDPTKPEAPVETETITPTTQERPPVPDWLRSNAAWWGKGQIDDKEFTNGISYLIQKQIIDVPELLQPNVSPEKIENPDTGVMEEPEEFTPVVPDWVQNNALWWSEGQLTDDDFLMGIKYLLEKGIIQVLV